MTVNVKAVVAGQQNPLSKLGDGVFSEGFLGEGVYVAPKTDSTQTVFAPVSGDLEMVFPQGHAYGIKTAEGYSILVHIGIDTVNLKGEGFQIKVKQGEKIQAGEPLVDVDFAYIAANATSPNVVVLNAIESTGKAKFSASTQPVVVGDDMFQIES